MAKMTRYEEDSKIFESLSNATVKCKHCGHSKTMPNAERTICNWCGYWIYKNDLIEFKYLLKERIKKNEKEI